MYRFSALLAPLLWITLIAVYVLAMLPPGDAPQLGNDKIQHMAAFFTLAVLAGLALPRVAGLWIAGGLALFGAAIEVSQLVTNLGRQASMADWFADVFAIAAGLLFVAPIRRRMQESR